jgi:hypothetical protein
MEGVDTQTQDLGGTLASQWKQPSIALCGELDSRQGSRMKNAAGSGIVTRSRDVGRDSGRDCNYVLDGLECKLKRVRYGKDGMVIKLWLFALKKNAEPSVAVYGVSVDTFIVFQRDALNNWAMARTGNVS